MIITVIVVAPLGREKKRNHESYCAHDPRGFVWLGFTILVLLMVVLLPAAALLTRALIPVTAASIVVLFVASCFSRRMRNWLYS